MNSKKYMCDLFQYNQASDRDAYSTEWSNVSIDLNTGKLTLSCFVSRDPFSMRMGSVSKFEWTLPYERLYEILRNYKNIRIINPKLPKEPEILRGLTEETWEDWVYDNGLL